MATITKWEMRLVLDRNRNAFDGRPRHAAADEVPPGLYWDPERREVVSIPARQRTDRALLSIHEKPDASLDDVVRQLAMGGGGVSGKPVPYEVARAAESQHH